MNKFIIFIVILLIFFGRTLISTQLKRPPPTPTKSRSSVPDSFNDNNNSAFRCDGRIYCSEMTSCEEAEFFLKNCSGIKMDGDGDGIPCEKQWCM